MIDENLENIFDSLLKYLEERFDTVDQLDGSPGPNLAMNLHRDIEEYIKDHTK